jgi:glycosyltransferase involved in cell wall biosynthesis
VSLDVVLADDGIAFDGASFREGPLGGAESAVVGLAEGLAARGHQVRVYTRASAPVTVADVAWRPFADGLPARADLYIANRSWRLIDQVPGAASRVFWIHNPAGYLLKWRYLARLWRRRPVIVFSGPYHRQTYPGWAPGGPRVVVPYGVTDLFRPVPREPPPPRAIFASNPMRGLDRLIELWVRSIRPRVPDAELHIYAGTAVYGGGGRHGATMTAILERARAAPGVMIAAPVDKPALAAVYGTMRVMLYGGDVGETFCLAVAEAQATGLPCVVRPVGSVGERVLDGATGFVVADDAGFADRAVDLLRDDGLWRRVHAGAVRRGAESRWSDAAAAFERLARGDLPCAA